jgi:hypothetical protein
MDGKRGALRLCFRFVWYQRFGTDAVQSLNDSQVLELLAGTSEGCQRFGTDAVQSPNDSQVLELLAGTSEGRIPAGKEAAQIQRSIQTLDSQVCSSCLLITAGKRSKLNSTHPPLYVPPPGSRTSPSPVIASPAQLPK